MWLATKVFLSNQVEEMIFNNQQKILEKREHIHTFCSSMMHSNI